MRRTAAESEDELREAIEGVVGSYVAVRAVLVGLLLTACAPAGPTSPVEGIVTDVQVASLTEG